MKIEKLKEYVGNWFSFYKANSYPINVREHSEAYNLIISKIETEKIRIMDIDKFIDDWAEAGEDNFYYTGARDMLINLIERGFLDGPKKETKNE